MRVKPLAKLQIGKSGITQGFVQSVELALKTHSRVRISALKSSGRDKKIIREMAEEVVKKLKTKCDYKIIGFTIILIKTKK